MQKELLTPAAILVGSLVIATGLYLGLQRPAPSSGPPPAGAEAAAASVKAPPAPADAQPPSQPHPAPAAAPPARPRELYERVEADAVKALEARRALFVKQCWEPSVRKNPAPPRAKYLFNMTFDESGREIARGISEVRGMERPDAAQCLRMIPLGIGVPPPGTRVAVEIEMILP
ncbi:MULTISPECIES: hypothetical protein [Sorangium]|uniref:Uncharacterized protein n=1 Tax=Sorangium cellulosum TaxID=56 RepID=A0A4P2QR82_SORCE|nr:MULTISPECIES: hypothetical protein [Sorangium]AUX32685.1 hypothetical protein SOCE836_048300 [Sorangium cellulosum]WCQ92061.1 hypothetical protein NQZ70_04790 [Sorangium sp. Soce836]